MQCQRTFSVLVDSIDWMERQMAETVRAGDQWS